MARGAFSCGDIVQSKYRHGWSWCQHTQSPGSRPGRSTAAASVVAGTLADANDAASLDGIEAERLGPCDDLSVVGAGVQPDFGDPLARELVHHCHADFRWDVD